jgi:hypothetical protein
MHCISFLLHFSNFKINNYTTTTKDKIMGLTHTLQKQYSNSDVQQFHQYKKIKRTITSHFKVLNAKQKEKRHTTFEIQGPDLGKEQNV